MNAQHPTAETSNAAPHEHLRHPFRLLRASAVAFGVVVFLFLFRPFGLILDSATDTLVLLGLAPLNILAMLGIHYLPIWRESWRTVVALCCLLIGNSGYLAIWSQSAQALEIGLSVALVVGMTAAIVALWNRGRIPEQELADRRSDAAVHRELLTLTGTGADEVVQLAPAEILFMKANGNYVDLYYRTGKGVEKAMLRSSLARLAAQVTDNRLIQCHRSLFVNLSAARRIVRSRGRTLIEFDHGERIPVSRKFRQQVREEISA
ncbi:MAG: LytTR family transcriptional regulator [Gammaproteobacteria bacterium]|nr:LytTR family transcriptional regulator [Gammaproteobacteria bacterium]MDH5302730.1 LytTR family transcriptional regulator [Gammaproteobacteria bacterium]MDH5321338.1 LytTR family transcriptional regulator [Gammaproteobacteria bacterium]